MQRWVLAIIDKRYWPHTLARGLIYGQARRPVGYWSTALGNGVGDTAGRREPSGWPWWGHIPKRRQCRRAVVGGVAGRVRMPTPELLEVQRLQVHTTRQVVQLRGLGDLIACGQVCGRFRGRSTSMGRVGERPGKKAPPASRREQEAGHNVGRAQTAGGCGAPAAPARAQTCATPVRSRCSKG